MLKRVSYDFVLRAMEPISHLEGTEGNVGIHARAKVRHKGRWVMVPMVSANSARNRIRAAASHAMMEAVGMDSGFSESAMRLLFNGGALAGRGSSGAVSLDEYRMMTDLCPPLALLGGCVGNRIVPGRLSAGELLVMCSEARAYFPEWSQEWLEEHDGWSPAREFLVSTQRVRFDPSLDPSKRLMLSEAEQVRVNDRLAASERAAEKDDAIERADTKSQLMPFTFEAIPRGSHLWWNVSGLVLNELEEDTLSTIVGLFLADAHVGGKINSGHGLVQPVAGRNMEITPAADTSRVTALGKMVGERFRDHVQSRKDALREWLGKVAA